MHESQLSEISNYMVKLLFARWERLILFAEHVLIHNYRLYSSAIQFHDPLHPIPYSSCIGMFTYTCIMKDLRCYELRFILHPFIGFVDGTKIDIRRPSVMQREFYNKYKGKGHSVKHQSVVTPDGLLICFTHPLVGRHHDIYLLRKSGLREKLDELFAGSPDDNPLHFVYGDLGYYVTRRVLCGFKRSRHMTDEQKLLNKVMSAVRVSVEWGFAWLKTTFPFITTRRNYEILRRPTGKYTMVRKFMCNNIYYT